MANLSQFKTPAQFIDALLKERGWTRRTLAIALGIEDSGISRIMSDKQAIGAPMAVLLEDIFSVPAQEFLEVQKTYDLAKARIAMKPDPIRRISARLFSELPIYALAKRRWIEVDNIRDTDTVIKAINKFFGFEIAGRIEAVSYSGPDNFLGSPIALIEYAWLHRARNIAAKCRLLNSRLSRLSLQ